MVLANTNGTALGMATCPAPNLAVLQLPSDVHNKLSVQPDKPAPDTRRQYSL